MIDLYMTFTRFPQVAIKIIDKTQLLPGSLQKVRFIIVLVLILICFWTVGCPSKIRAMPKTTKRGPAEYISYTRHNIKSYVYYLHVHSSNLGIHWIACLF